MTPSDPLGTLIALARERRDAALGALGRALAASRTSSERLALLERYRDEYRDRLAQSIRRGVSVGELANFQAFLAKLDLAIAQQAEEVRAREQTVTEGRAKWQAADREEQSFATLKARSAAREAHRVHRAEQRGADEVAARIASRKPE